MQWSRYRTLACEMDIDHFPVPVNARPTAEIPRAPGSRRVMGRIVELGAPGVRQVRGRIAFIHSENRLLNAGIKVSGMFVRYLEVVSKIIHAPSRTSCRLSGSVWVHY